MREASRLRRRERGGALQGEAISSRQQAAGVWWEGTAVSERGLTTPCTGAREAQGLSFPECRPRAH
jgi:hypothetical protein